MSLQGKQKILNREAAGSNLAQRLLTGFALVVCIVLSILGGPYTFLFIVMVINTAGLLEFYRLFRSSELIPQKTTGILLSLCLLLTSFLVAGREASWKLLLLILPFAFLVFITELHTKSKNPFPNIAITFLGIGCIAVPLSFLMGVAFLPFNQNHYHPAMLLGYFIILWTNDAGAFFIGKAFGQHKLFYRISPNKTWEGSLGGLAMALLAGFLNTRLFPLIALNTWLAMTLIIVVSGTYGDLLKSMMKRSLGIKDSGTLLPGHGGMLDRFDSLLGSAPFVFCYLLLWKDV